jgi:hypothetical protein
MVNTNKSEKIIEIEKILHKLNLCEDVINVILSFHNETETETPSHYYHIPVKKLNISLNALYIHHIEAWIDRPMCNNTTGMITDEVEKERIKWNPQRNKLSINIDGLVFNNELHLYLRITANVKDGHERITDDTDRDWLDSAKLLINKPIT